MNILQKRAIMMKNRQELLEQLKFIDDRIKMLDDSRVDCEHVWLPPIKGHEEEGQCCANCGINDIYLPTFLKQQGR